MSRKRNYNEDYLKYGVIKSPVDSDLPLCLICLKTFSNEGMKFSTLLNHL